jgi:hypothetical protein
LFIKSGVRNNQTINENLNLVLRAKFNKKTRIGKMWRKRKNERNE